MKIHLVPNGWPRGKIEANEGLISLTEHTEYSLSSSDPAIEVHSFPSLSAKPFPASKAVLSSPIPGSYCL